MFSSDFLTFPNDESSIYGPENIPEGRGCWDLEEVQTTRWTRPRLSSDSEPLLQLLSCVIFSQCLYTLATLGQRLPVVPQIIFFSPGTQEKQAVALRRILANGMYIVHPRLCENSSVLHLEFPPNLFQESQLPSPGPFTAQFPQLTSLCSYIPEIRLFLTHVMVSHVLPKSKTSITLKNSHCKGNNPSLQIWPLQHVV